LILAKQQRSLFGSIAQPAFGFYVQRSAIFHTLREGNLSEPPAISVHFR
jgi:hypothetical protein